MTGVAMSDLPLAGRVALITGASSGFGAHFAGVLARAGASVCAAARRVDRLTDVCRQVEADGGTAMAVTLDVTDGESIGRAVGDCADALGGIDILVNNAGIATPGATLDITESQWNGVIDTNLTGPFLMAQAVARRMIDDGRAGRIVNVASILGSQAATRVAAYAASKAGLIQLTRVLALEFARHGICVNALAPGYVETDLNREFINSDVGQAMRERIPHRRFGEPADLDGALLLLAGDGSRYMTGSVITVDGGHSVALA